MAVEHEIDQCAFKTGTFSDIDRKSCSAYLCSPFKVKNPERFAQFKVVFDWKVKIVGKGYRILEDLIVVSRTSGRNGWVQFVGEPQKKSFDILFKTAKRSIHAGNFLRNGFHLEDKLFR